MSYTWADVGSTWATIGGNTWQSLFLPPLEPSTAETRVELGLQRAFLLDDPIAGIIGGTTFVLSGEEYVDITNYVFSVSTDRGKNTELDRYKSGTASIQLRNQNRYFDPTYLESPFAGNLTPRRGIRILSNSVPIFTGRVADWNIDYAPGNDSVASIEAVDNFTLLATQLLTAGTVVQQTTGQRISAVLNMPTVDWPTNEQIIGTGQSTLGSAVLTGEENTLTYLQQVELSEFNGALFIDKAGYLVFRDRLEALEAPIAATFTDDGTGIRFTDFAIEYGSEQLYNQVTVTSPAGTAVANDFSSQSLYGISSKFFDTLLSSQTQLDLAAGFIKIRYSTPTLRIKQLSVNLKDLTELERATLLELELADGARVIVTPNGIGDPIDKHQIVIGISHDIDVANHVMTFSFGELQTDVFTIGDPVLGTIGVNAPGVLGF